MNLSNEITNQKVCLNRIELLRYFQQNKINLWFEHTLACNKRQSQLDFHRNIVFPESSARQTHLKFHLFKMK